MAENSRNTVASEDELGEKWDRCVADTILKTGTSLVHRLPENEDAGKFLIRAHPYLLVIRARWHADRQTA